MCRKHKDGSCRPTSHKNLGVVKSNNYRCKPVSGFGKSYCIIKLNVNWKATLSL